MLKIGVIGIGNAGSQVALVAHKEGIESMVLNSSEKDLAMVPDDMYKIPLGDLKGAGKNREGAKKFLQEVAGKIISSEKFINHVGDKDVVFIVSSCGGGTGSGAGYVVAEVARELGILVVGVATRPFSFEGEKRRVNADWAISHLGREVDTLITIPNDRLLQTIDRRTPLLETFKIADDVLRQGVQGISELITEHGLINLDFADVKAIMSNAGSALMGIGRASGDDRAVQAAQQAIESPLIEVSIDGAKGVLFNVTGGYDMSMAEIQEAAEIITSAVSPNANIIFGATLKPEMEDELVITVIATGFDSDTFRQQEVSLTVGDDTKPAETEVDDEMVKNIDLELDKEESAESFAAEPETNIWENPTVEADDDEDDTPAFLRRRKKNKE